MKNVDVIKSFINGETNAGSKSLRIVEGEFGTKLFNRNTCLAERRVVSEELRGFKVNMTKYNPSTTAIQNNIVSLLPKPVKVATNIPVGAEDLWTV